MKGGRPRRPALEAVLVREAVAGVDPSAPREPLARDLASRVVGFLRDHAAEGVDPIHAARGQLQRAFQPSPALTLATDPDIDTLSVFVEVRVAALIARNGWPIHIEDELRNVELALQAVERRLWRRYLKILRS